MHVIFGVDVRLAHDVPYFVYTGLEFPTPEDGGTGVGEAVFHLVAGVVMVRKERAASVRYRISIYVYTTPPHFCRHCAARQNLGRIAYYYINTDIVCVYARRSTEKSDMVCVSGARCGVLRLEIRSVHPKPKSSAGAWS